MSSSSSVIRRLHGLFGKSINLSPKPETTIIINSSPIPTPLTTTIATAKRKTTSTTSPSQKARKLKKVVEKCKQLSQSPEYRARFRNYESLVLSLASANQPSMIEDLMEHLKTYEEISTERFAIRLISLYGKSGMFEHAHKVFDEMPDLLKCAPTVLSMNALLGACVCSKRFEKFEGLLKELPSKLSVEPDLVTYNTVINALCEMGSLESAVSVIGTMEEKGIEPDLISYNTLLDWFYANNRFSEGENIWAMIDSKGLTPNIRSYNSRLRGLMSEGRVLEAVELFDELKSKDLKPDQFSYNAIIKGLCKDGNLEEVKKWYSSKLLECELRPDKYTFATLVPFLCGHGDLDMAFEVCKKILEQRCLVNVVTMQLVVDGLVKESKMKEAKELVKIGRSNDHYCYNLKLPSSET